MHLRHLDDDHTRELMLEELDRDVQDGSVYLSRRLTESGHARWPDILREAVTGGTPADLAGLIRAEGALHTHESKGSGRPGMKRVPSNAAEMLAQGEFNRYYMRALCRRALDNGLERVQWCRARHSDSVRPESAQLDGQPGDAVALLEDLQRGVHVAGGPNSGMTLCLVPRETQSR